MNRASRPRIRRTGSSPAPRARRNRPAPTPRAGMRPSAVKVAAIAASHPERISSEAGRGTISEKNPENFKSKAGRQIGRKNGPDRGDPVQGFAKLDHPVSRERAGKKSGDRGSCKLGCTQTITNGGQGRSRTGDDRPWPVHRAGRGWLRPASCAQTQPFGARETRWREPAASAEALPVLASGDGSRRTTSQ